MVGSTVAMPPRSSLTSSFAVTDPANEVVCPLRNQDGSMCRKRCLGEKRFRSMQEHIRRAHPEHYISKLPATEESFQLMIETPPSERPPPTSNANPSAYGHNNESRYMREGSTAPNTPRNPDDYHAGSLPPAAHAAAALAQMQNQSHGGNNHDYDSSENEWQSDTEADTKAMRSSIELPPIHNHANHPTSAPFSTLQEYKPRDLLPSMFANSPPGRSSTLPPIQRNGMTRPRKQSLSKRAREPQHKRQKSKESPHLHLKRLGYTRDAFSAEPSSAMSGHQKLDHRRWLDLIDAATSATEEEDEKTPVPPSPMSVQRASMPPSSMPTYQGSQFQGYQNSPLQQALTPPTTYANDAPDPFPSVESNGSGDQFHMNINRDLSDSSPSYSSQNIQIYCAACQNVSALKESYACTECVCGICQQCVDVLLAEQGVRRKCPRCATVGGRFKPFQLDIR